MLWQEICEHSALQNLPFKIESTKQGAIIMSPVNVSHSIFQGRITRKLNAMLEDGEAIVECAIATKQGTKVADVAWASNKRIARIKHEIECSIAPEICVEVVPCSNTQREIRGKSKLYFEAGALEVWHCAENGRMTFYSPAGKMSSSALAPAFPAQIEL